ncbi:MAG: universal stress protein [Salinibacter sp.]
MLHVAHILCLVAPGSAAPAHAFFLTRRLDATLHVLPHPLLAEPEDGEGRMEALRAEDEGVPVPTERPADLPASMTEVLRYVEGRGIDLVLTDTPSDRGAVPPLAVEATRTLVRQLSCPVFVVEHEGTPAALRNLLVPTDLSDPSLCAFQHAVNLARLYDAAVHVLHVVDSPPYVALTPTDRLSFGPHPLSEHRGRRRLRAFLGDEEAADVPLHAHLTYGDPADQIPRFADQTDTDLVVLASHGPESSPNTPLGQVAARVLGRMTRPLFLVRASGASLLPPSAEGESESSSGEPTA